ncbi:MAG: prepilin-type N-terminal cleavage/methylation domain-containing protein [Firmicutes bacterium]|nr:prepilin-type N-terminal cleavage/methylation domain-containing protein [Bacillota bacterium]
MKFSEKFSEKKGFTLVEVIIAVAILSIIATTLAVAFTKFSRMNMHNEVTRRDRELVVSDLENDIDNVNTPDNTDNDFEIYDANVKINFSETHVTFKGATAADEEFNDSIIYRQKIYTRTEAEDASKQGYMLIGAVKEIETTTTAP